MSYLYIDTSASAAILFKEPGHEELKTLFSQHKKFSSHLLEAELLAAAHRENIEIRMVEELTDRITFISPTRSLGEEYRLIFSAGYCRGADAYHLATLLFLAPNRESLAFLTMDGRQIEIAKKIGIRVLPKTG